MGKKWVWIIIISLVILAGIFIFIFLSGQQDQSGSCEISEVIFNFYKINPSENSFLIERVDNGKEFNNLTFRMIIDGTLVKIEDYDWNIENPNFGKINSSAIFTIKNVQNNSKITFGLVKDIDYVYLPDKEEIELFSNDKQQVKFTIRSPSCYTQ